MKYNYVIFDCLNQEYYKTLLEDLKYNENVKLYHEYLQGERKILKLLFKIHYSKKIRKYVNLPFKSIWNKKLFTNSFNSNSPICFMFSSNTYELIDGNFFAYLKKIYPNSKLVYYCRDLIELIGTRFMNFDINRVKKSFDLVITYNMLDSIKHNLVFFPDFASKLSDKCFTNFPEVDVLFIGKAKNRLNDILASYKIFERKGLSCYFYITNASADKQTGNNNIIFSDKLMSYTEYLGRLKSSKMLLEIVQDGTIGFSTRTFEAIMYGKKLITNAHAIKYTKFYNSNVFYFSKVEELNKYDFLNAITEDYNYKNEFSPVNTLQQIDDYFSKNYKANMLKADWFSIPVNYEEFLVSNVEDK